MTPSRGPMPSIPALCLNQSLQLLHLKIKEPRPNRHIQIRYYCLRLLLMKMKFFSTNLKIEVSIPPEHAFPQSVSPLQPRDVVLIATIGDSIPTVNQPVSLVNIGVYTEAGPSTARVELEDPTANPHNDMSSLTLDPDRVVPPPPSPSALPQDAPSLDAAEFFLRDEEGQGPDEDDLIIRVLDTLAQNLALRLM
ncbi:hypothetical protein Fmac_019191 [Flemingia macrophylla]|uniref:Uncharacterized protein n=1 Tax=Flemingia macrophylla TaxID=520843 RepID=A0ABD1M925_9FABA